MSRTNDVSDRYIGLGNLNQYSFDFKVSGDASDLLIIKTDADNNVIFKVRGDDTEYIDNVAFNDGNVGGTVTLIDNLETDYILTIRLLPENPEQDDQYRNQSDFSLKKLENSFDQQNGYIQAMWDILKRVPRIPDQFLASDMDPTLLGEIDDVLDLSNGDEVFLTIKKEAGKLKFDISTGSTNGLSDVQADVADLQLYKEDRTRKSTAITDGQTITLDSNSERVQVFTGAIGSATVLMPEVSTLNVGRSFIIDNQCTGTPDPNSDGYLIVETSIEDQLKILQWGQTYKFTCLSLSDNNSSGWEVERVEKPAKITYDDIQLLNSDAVLDNTCSEYIRVTVPTPDTYYLVLPRADSMNGRHIIINHVRTGGGVDVSVSRVKLWIKNSSGSLLHSPGDGLAEGAAVLAVPGGYDQWFFFAIGNQNIVVGDDGQKMVLNELGVTGEIVAHGDIKSDDDLWAADDVNVGDTVRVGGYINMQGDNTKTSPGQIEWSGTRVPTGSGNSIDYFTYQSQLTPTIDGTTTAGSGTYDEQSLEYVRLSFVIFFSIRLKWTAHTGTGNMKISGLPVAANLGIFGGRVACSVAHSNIALTAGYTLQAEIDTAGTSITLTQVPTGGGAAIAVPLDTAGEITVSGWYNSFGA